MIMSLRTLSCVRRCSPAKTSAALKREVRLMMARMTCRHEGTEKALATLWQLGIANLKRLPLVRKHAKAGRDAATEGL